MSNALVGLAMVAFVVKCSVYDTKWLQIYGASFAAYLVFVLVYRGCWHSKDNNKRRTLTASTWNGKAVRFDRVLVEPCDPTAYLTEDINVTQALAYLKQVNNG